jgi:hypothetical protein
MDLFCGQGDEPWGCGATELVWQILTDVSEVLTAAVVRAMSLRENLKSHTKECFS